MEKARKILLIKSGAIGDVLMTTPLVRALRINFPKAEIHYYTGKWSAPVLEGNRNIDKIKTFDDNIIFRKKILKLLKLRKEIMKEKYDVCFVLDWSYLAGMFVLSCRIPVRVGFDRKGEGIFHTTKVHYSDEKHDIKYYLDLARAIGAKKEADNYNMEIFISKKEKKKMEEIARKIWGKTIGLVPGGAKNPGQTLQAKRWAADKYAELAKKILSETNFNIILFGGVSDIEINKKIGKKIAKISGRTFDFAGKLNLKETAALMKKCQIIVCNDSGPMHLASAVSTPVLSIFGPTNPKKLAPIGENNLYLWKKARGMAVYKNGKLSRGVHSLERLSSEEVFEKLMQLYNKIYK
ncbi:MAG TPA: lipopolysaccharide heptosyltransferase II [Candidatus Nanoarchaeia archaeon]|nr:lipopolysaccharide heptosyltransferase II [Candidatus Nanoarchaeia archaeon]